MNDHTGPDIRYVGVAYNNTPPDPALISNALNGLYRVREGDTLRYTLNPNVIGNDELRELLQRYNAFLPKDDRLVFNEEVIWLHGVPSPTLAFSGLKSLAALEKMGADISSSNNVMAASHVNCLAPDAQAKSVTESLKKGFKSIPKEQVRLSDDKQLEIFAPQHLENAEAIKLLMDLVNKLSDYSKANNYSLPQAALKMDSNGTRIIFDEPLSQKQLGDLANLELALPAAELLKRYAAAVDANHTR